MIWTLHFTAAAFSLSPFFPLLSRRSLAVDLLHISKRRGVWSNTPRYFTNTCFRRRCPKFAAFRPFRRPALGRETNRPRNETPVVDLIYTPAGVPYIHYLCVDGSRIIEPQYKKYRRPFGAKRTYRGIRQRFTFIAREYSDKIITSRIFLIVYLQLVYYIMTTYLFFGVKLYLI